MESSRETELRLTRENFSVNAARQSDAEYELTGGYSLMQLVVLPIRSSAVHPKWIQCRDVNSVGLQALAM